MQYGLLKKNILIKLEKNLTYLSRKTKYTFLEEFIPILDENEQLVYLLSKIDTKIKNPIDQKLETENLHLLENCINLQADVEKNWESWTAFTKKNLHELEIMNQLKKHLQKRK